MKEKTTAIYIIIAVAVFGVLLALATAFDFNISLLLADLQEGEYHSQNLFACIFETIGEMPLYFFLAYAAAVVFWNAFYAKNPYIKYVLMTIAAIGICFLGYYVPNKASKYVLELGGSVIANPILDIVLDVLFDIAFSAAAIFGVLSTGKKNIKKQLGFAVIIFFVAASTQAFTQGLKFINKRVRFRAMNALGEFDYFTPWYSINGYPDEFKAIASTLGSGDCLRSFPSGHTTAAGITYTLLALPYAFSGLNKKGWKIFFTLISVTYTGTVAVSRIVMGAHYFSDVLVGGSVAFLAATVAVWLIYKKKIISPLQKYIGDESQD